MPAFTTSLGYRYPKPAFIAGTRLEAEALQSLSFDSTRVPEELVGTFQAATLQEAYYHV